jgi:hypothetical protein
MGEVSGVLDDEPRIPDYSFNSACFLQKNFSIGFIAT